MKRLLGWLSRFFPQGKRNQQKEALNQPLKFSVKRRASELKRNTTIEKEELFKIRLCPDEFHLPDVGHLESGVRYWIDRQVARLEGRTHDFLATYIFDEEGRLIWHKIDDLGSRPNEIMHLTPALRDEVDLLISNQLKRLGPGRNADFWVLPFSVNAFGHTFGLVVRSDEECESDDGPFVDVLPGLTLMFHAPWDEGVYAS